GWGTGDCTISAGALATGQPPYRVKKDPEDVRSRVRHLAEESWALGALLSKPAGKIHARPAGPEPAVPAKAGITRVLLFLCGNLPPEVSAPVHSRETRNGGGHLPPAGPAQARAAYFGITKGAQ